MRLRRRVKVGVEASGFCFVSAKRKEDDCAHEGVLAKASQSFWGSSSSRLADASSYISTVSTARGPHAHAWSIQRDEGGAEVELIWAALQLQTGQNYSGIGQSGIGDALLLFIGPHSPLPLLP